MKYCTHCGAEVNPEAVICVKCGCSTAKEASSDSPESPIGEGFSEKSGLAVLLLCLFVGALGIHRFYVGKTGTGVAQLLTCGGCGIWVLIDLIMIITGSFTDDKGKIVKL